MKTIKENRYFFYPLAAFLIIGALLLFVFNKGEVELWVNSQYHPFWSNFFYYATSLGNGLLVMLIVIFLGAYRLKYALTGLMVFTVTGLYTQLLKKLFFPHMVRPKVFFEGLEHLNFVEGVKLASFHSFPSGHTSVAFSLFCLLALISPNKKLGWVFFLLALFAGLSRIYLMQHFLIDVYFGTILGILCTVFTYNFVIDTHWYKYNKTLNRSLIDLFGPRKE